MCLITEQKEPKIATEDIVCYKELNENKTSYVKEFKYKLNKLYKQKISSFVINDYHDDFLFPEDESMYYYSSKIRNDEEGSFIAVQKGFHSCNSIEKSKKYKEQVWNKELHTFKCIIPKGSEYYEDATGLICSNQIIIIEQL